MNLEEIYTKAKELGIMISESDDAKALKAAEELHLADDEAQQLMMDYTLRMEKLSEEASKPGITQEELDKLQMDAQAEMIRICQNKNIERYLEANRKFNNLINQVNGIIAHFVRGEENSGCGGSCGSCGKCHY